MRVLFFGSGEFGLPTLAAMRDSHELVGVVSQPDKPAGRKRLPTATPIAAWAASQGLPVFKTADVNTPQFVAQMAECAVDATVVIAFGQKLSPPLIAALGRLTVNLHASLLPQYRGAAPIQRAMLDNVPMTGVSVIALASTMDAGEVYAQQSLVIDPLETAGELHDRLALLGPAAVLGVLDDLKRGVLKPVVQDHAAATRAPKFNKADGTTDFVAASSDVRARIHGLTPWPGCRVAWIKAAAAGQTETVALTLRKVRELQLAAPAGVAPGQILSDGCVACGSGRLELLEVQVPGGRPLQFDAFRQGHLWAAGGCLQAWEFSHPA